YVITIGPSIYIFDSQSFKLIKTLKTDDSQCLGVAFSKDGEQLYAMASTRKKELKIFIIEWRTGLVLNQSSCSGHDRQVTAIAFAPNRKIVATVGRDLRLKIWQCRDGRELKSFQAHNSLIMNIAALPGEAKFLTVAQSESLRLWDFENSAILEQKLKERFSKETIAALEKNPTSRSSRKIIGEWLSFRKVHTLAIAHLEEAKKQGEEIPELALARHYWATNQWDKSAASFTRILASGKWTAPIDKNYLELCQEAVDREAIKWKTQVKPAGQIVRAIVTHPKKKQLIIAGDALRKSPVITILDIESRQVIRKLYGHKQAVQRLAVSADGRWLLSGGPENSALLWFLETGQMVQKLPGHNKAVTFVGLNKDGTRAVTIADDQKVRLWDLQNNVLMKTVKPHKFFLRACALSPNFEKLLTSDTRGNIKLIDLKSGEVTKTIPGQARGYKSIVFSPNGQFIA
ncbi:MAG: WD40 repeat domain-containing protein, partial [Planctomycetota bacterium]|nr:WD40 repeat domain-containing protein [Planctomycetota bacterium]